MRDHAPGRAPMRVALVLSLHGVVLPLAAAVRDCLESPWTPRGRGLAVLIGLPGRPSLPLLGLPIRSRSPASSLTAAAPSTLTLQLLQFIRLVRARVCSLSVHRPHGGLPQTGPADSAGAQEHRHPPPDQLHQGDNRSGQRVRRERRAAQWHRGTLVRSKAKPDSDIYYNSRCKSAVFYYKCSLVHSKDTPEADACLVFQSVRSVTARVVRKMCWK